jgi:hypothetical protein
MCCEFSEDIIFGFFLTDALACGSFKKPTHVQSTYMFKKFSIVMRKFGLECKAPTQYLGAAPVVLST